MTKVYQVTCNCKRSSNINLQELTIYLLMFMLDSTLFIITCGAYLSSKARHVNFKGLIRTEGEFFIVIYKMRNVMQTMYRIALSEKRFPFNNSILGLGILFTPIPPSWISPSPTPKMPTRVNFYSLARAIDASRRCLRVLIFFQQPLNKVITSLGQQTIQQHHDAFTSEWKESRCSTHAGGDA